MQLELPFGGFFILDYSVFTYELQNLRELRQAFDPKLVDKAFQRALQVASMKAKTRISRKVRATYNIKAAAVGRSVQLRKLQSEPGRLLLYTGRMLGLDKFSARPKKVRTAAGRRVGVTVQVKKSGGRKLVKGAFLGGKGKVIFTREGEGRLPIERKFGPSIAHMVGNKDVLTDFEAHVGEDAATEFNRYLEFLMTSRTT